MQEGDKLTQAATALCLLVAGRLLLRCGVVKPLASRAGVTSSPSRPYPGIRLSGSFDCAALVFSSIVWSVLVVLGDSAQHPLFFGVLLDLLYLAGWLWGGCIASRVVVV